MLRVRHNLDAKLFMRDIRRAATGFKKRVVREVYRELVDRTPVAHPSEGTPGKLRASWAVGVGTPPDVRLPDQASYPIPGDDVVDAAIAGMGPDDQVHITNNAETEQGSGESYAELIDQGRRTDSRGRGVGSFQAPQGIVQPSLDAVEARHHGWRLNDPMTDQGG